MEEIKARLRDLWLLSEVEQDHIKDLQGHPGFVLFLERLAHAELVALRQAVSKEGTQFHRGLYQGYAGARVLIELMLRECIANRTGFAPPDLDPDDTHRRKLCTPAS